MRHLIIQLVYKLISHDPRPYRKPVHRRFIFYRMIQCIKNLFTFLFQWLPFIRINDRHKLIVNRHLLINQLIPFLCFPVLMSQLRILDLRILKRIQPTMELRKRTLPSAIPKTDNDTMSRKNIHAHQIAMLRPTGTTIVRRRTITHRNNKKQKKYQSSGKQPNVSTGKSLRSHIMKLRPPNKIFPRAVIRDAAGNTQRLPQQRMILQLFSK